LYINTVHLDPALPAGRRSGEIFLTWRLGFKLLNFELVMAYRKLLVKPACGWQVENEISVEILGCLPAGRLV